MRLKVASYYELRQKMASADLWDVANLHYLI